MAKKGVPIEIVATNRKAYHFFHILETYEAGIGLKGPEVKSVRQKKVSLDGSFARLDRNEAYLYNVHIAPYSHNTTEIIDPTRTRKLLLNHQEIKRLIGKLQIKKFTLIPLQIHFKRGWAKVLLGLAKGKTGPDRREDIKKRDLGREMRAHFKEKFKA